MGFGVCKKEEDYILLSGIVLYIECNLTWFNHQESTTHVNIMQTTVAYSQRWTTF